MIIILLIYISFSYFLYVRYLNTDVMIPIWHQAYDAYELSTVRLITQIVGQLLAYMNSCVNPILYAFLSENFRKAFNKVIACNSRDQHNGGGTLGGQSTTGTGGGGRLGGRREESMAVNAANEITIDRTTGVTRTTRVSNGNV